MVVYKFYAGAILVSDPDDPLNIMNELEQHGKLWARNITKKDGDPILSAALWKHDIPGARDEYYLMLIIGKKSLREGVKRGGSININKFAEDYPKLPLFDIGTQINASSIVKGIKDHKREKVKQGGINTKPLMVGAIVIRKKEHFENLLRELEQNKGKSGEVWNKFIPEDNVGIILWVRDTTLGIRHYYVFIVLLKKGGLFRIFQPGNKIKINNIKKYGIPIYEIPLMKRKILIPDIINSFEKQLKNQ